MCLLMLSRSPDYETNDYEPSGTQKNQLIRYSIITQTIFNESEFCRLTDSVNKVNVNTNPRYPH